MYLSPRGAGANLEGVRVKNSQFNYANLARSSFRRACTGTFDPLAMYSPSAFHQQRCQRRQGS
eukprot:2442646-Pleurochrysis_carterae.AAC.6